MKEIIIENAHAHNLKNIDVTIPRNKFIVVTGPSGSGKSSLIYETLHLESQKRYLEALSSFGKNFFQPPIHTKVSMIKGISPTLAIDQKTTINNKRSTVGTVTEIYDFLRLLFTHLGTPHSPTTKAALGARDQQDLIHQIGTPKAGARVVIMAPIILSQKGEQKDVIDKMINKYGIQSIVIDQKIYEVGQLPKVDKNKYHDIFGVVDRIIYSPQKHERMVQSIVTSLKLAENSVIVDVDGKSQFYSLGSYCPVSKTNFPKLQPRLFSYNSPLGACKTCDGIGEIVRIDESTLLKNPTLPFNKTSLYKIISKDAPLFLVVKKLFSSAGVPLEFSSKEWPNEFKSHLFEGVKKFPGLIPYFKNLMDDEDTYYGEDNLAKILKYVPCPKCHGKRLQDFPLNVKLWNMTIDEFVEKDLVWLEDYFSKLILSDSDKRIGEKLCLEIRQRLIFLNQVGLGHLQLTRSAVTLSGGELQRIRLATQLGTSLSGVIYILDEPSIGLHPFDNEMLIKTIKQLRDLNNTVIVIEHDEQTMREADFILDIGPQSGINGGQVVYAGNSEKFFKTDNLTANFLKANEVKLPIHKVNFKQHLNILGIKRNNLKNIDIHIPINALTCITGRSGSGKSTLVHDVMRSALNELIFKEADGDKEYKSVSCDDHLQDYLLISQKPVGRTPKSIPLTYLGVFDVIREIYADTIQAKLQSLTPSHFSFNSALGRCETCEGNGRIKMQMMFLSDAYIPCSACKEMRYRPEILSIYYKGANIHDVLNMNASEALAHFGNYKKLNFSFELLLQVGLGYIKLGQPTSTLSGGEAQRIKIAKELSKLKRGKILYMLDEPSTGLHFQEIELLNNCLRKLVSQGHTVLVIEHNIDIIKHADYVIDLGPGGGKHGGEVVATGHPSDIAKNPRSLTGKFLDLYVAN
ncbi:MAG: excinuclease ABC subunit UvrA [Bacteriovoracaceae bacterium]|nr:excinuclease ABC subunit UvrA [Bacteriovoracaceae bacterium]